jgi:hypothetical protein
VAASDGDPRRPFIEAKRADSFISSSVMSFADSIIVTAFALRGVGAGAQGRA